MRDYSKISPAFWSGETGREIRKLGHHAQLLALYFISCPNSTAIGMYYLPLMYASHEIGMPLDAVMKFTPKLEALDFCRYDHNYDWVFVYEMARFQIAENLKPTDKRVAWVQSEITHCPSADLRSAFLDRYAFDFHLVNAPGGGASGGSERRKKVSPRLRLKVFERDLYTCQYCGHRAPEVQIELDHIVPVANGGKTIESNLVTACRECNNGKGTKALPEGLFDRLKMPLGEGVIEGPRCQEQEQEQEQEQNSGSSADSKSVRPRDLAMDHFTDRFRASTGSPYAIDAGDAVMLQKLRKVHGTPNLEMPPGWLQAVDNFFATPLAIYSLADLSNPKRYAVFRNSALDRFNKPLAHANGGGNSNHAESESERRDRETAESGQRLLNRLAAKTGGGLPSES